MKNTTSEKIRNIELPLLKFDTGSKEIRNVLFEVVKLEKTISTYKKYILNEYIKESKENDKFRGNERTMSIVDSLTNEKTFKSQNENNLNKTEKNILAQLLMDTMGNDKYDVSILHSALLKLKP